MVLAPLMLQSVVTFAAPTDVASRLIPKLGSTMGLRLETDRRAGRQVLLIHVKAMPRERLLGLVAETTGGQWFRTNDGLRLTIDNARMNALWREETKAREAWIAKRIALDPPTRANGGIALASPATYKAARSLGAAALAAVRPGERVVWSTSPTRLQLPLSSSTLEVGRWAIAAQESEREEIARNTRQEYVPAVPSDPTVVVFAARRGRETESVGMSFSGESSGASPFGVSGGFLSPPRPQPFKELADRLPKTAVPFPPSVTEWAKGEPWGALKEGFLHPESSEPLALGVGPAMEALAATAKTDLVACLPDSAYSAAQSPVSHGLSADWGRTLGDLGLVGRLDGETLILRPRSQASSIENRADRAVLRRRIVDVGFDGRLNFRYGMPNLLERSHLTLLSQRSTYPEIDDGSGVTWALAVLWESLSPTEQERALGDGLAFRDSTGLFDRFVAALLQPSSNDNEFAVRLRYEPTIVLADPRLASGVLRVRSVSNPAVVYQPEGQALPSADDNLVDLGVRLALRNPDDPVARKGTRFWPATHRLLTFSMGFEGYVLSSQFATVTRDDGSHASISPDLFPALREAVSRAGG